MMKSTRLFSLKKLKWLKKFLKTQKQLTCDIQLEISQAYSVGDIWCLLFRNALFEVYNTLINEGFVPTSDELNELCDDKQLPAWFWLSYQGTEKHQAVFERLLADNILPSSEALNNTTPDSHRNIWLLLAFYSNFHTIFQTLLTKNILPSLTALAQCTSLENVNVWYWLSYKDNDHKVFETLLSKGLLPHSNDLSARHSQNNDCVWLCLASGGPKHRLLFQTLLDLGITPTIDALTSCDTINRVNAWYWLAMVDEGITFYTLPGKGFIFDNLLDRGIIPNSSALSVCHTIHKVSAWYWLAKINYHTFKKLIDKNSLPSEEILSNYHPEDNTNSWYWLAKSIHGQAIFARLLAYHILPTAQILSKCSSTDCINTWSLLARHPSKGQTILNTLLDHDILPDLQALSLSGANACWFFLIAASSNMTVFNRLLDKGIWPSHEVLSTYYLQHHVSIWHYLATNARIASAKRLLRHGLLPSAEELMAHHIHTNHTTWYFLAQHLEGLIIFSLFLHYGLLPTPQVLAKRNTVDNRHVWHLLMSEESNLLSARQTVLQSLFDRDILPASDDVNRCLITDSRLKNRLSKRDKLNSYYHMDTSTAVAILLSRKKNNDSYIFLYLFYLSTITTHVLKIFPYHVWFKIGQHLIPNLTQVSFNNLDTCSNRIAFAKYHLIKTLDNYIKTKSGSLSFFSRSHIPRVMSLQLSIKNYENPTSLLRQQFFMSQHPKQRYVKDAYAAHEQPFKKKLRNGALKNTLHDGCFLTIS